MFFNRIFLVLFLTALCSLFGCFGDAENPLTEDVEGGVTEEEVLPAVPQHIESGGSAVRLVSDGYLRRWGGETLTCLYHLEIDAPLEYHLFVYTKSEAYGKKGMLFDGEHVRVNARRMLVIEKGDTVSGEYGWFGGFVNSKDTRSVISILPLSEIDPITPPRIVSLGTIEGNPARSRVTTEGIPRDHDYKPYRFGDPSEIEFVFIEEWERIAAEKKAAGAKDAEEWAEIVAEKKAGN